MSIVEVNVNEFIRGLHIDDDPLIQSMEEYARLNSVPIIEPEVAQLLKVLIMIHKPKRILEIGSAIGYSAITMKKAYPPTKITTIEIDEDSYVKARENIELAGFEKDIHCILGDANQVLDMLETEYDMIFMDAAKGQYISFFDKSIGLLKSKGMLISDNVLFRGMVANEEYATNRHRKVTIVRRLRDYLEYISSKDGFTTSIIPIDDGMAITYKD